MKYPNIDAEQARSGLTMNELSKALGVTRKTLYNWCNHGKIPQSALERMSMLFGGCSVDYLLEERREA